VRVLLPPSTIEAALAVRLTLGGGGSTVMDADAGAEVPLGLVQVSV
jgi:hypothetical protein